MKRKIRFGVNIDHVATLRQVRKARYPDIVEALHLCERGGADQITVHLREDRRHIQDHDVKRLLESSLLPINLEMALIPEMKEKALNWQPFSITLVPERREEMTTESGLDLKVYQKNKEDLAELSNQMHLIAFIDPDEEQVDRARDLGFEAVEFHTGPFASAFEHSLRSKDRVYEKEKERLLHASEKAEKVGLGVRAGHGLTIQNVQALCEVSQIEEFNIGHAIVARSIILGLEAAVREMKEVLKDAASVNEH